MSVEFTVGIPTHNRRETVLLALASALEQTRPPKRVIVVADGCTDGTQEAVRALGDDRVEVLDRPKGFGAGYAHRNEVLERAGEGIVAWLADDDLWLPDHLERAGELFDAGAADDRELDGVPGARGWDTRAIRGPLARTDLPRQVPRRREPHSIKRGEPSGRRGACRRRLADRSRAGRRLGSLAADGARGSTQRDGDGADGAVLQCLGAENRAGPTVSPRTPGSWPACATRPSSRSCEGRWRSSAPPTPTRMPSRSPKRTSARRSRERELAEVSAERDRLARERDRLAGELEAITSGTWWRMRRPFEPALRMRRRLRERV